MVDNESMDSLAFRAMQFAINAHNGQERKYTGEPYYYHMAEVVGILQLLNPSDHLVAIAWLHDVIEDQGITYEELKKEFGSFVADGVLMLSDLEEGNRATRKAASRERLSKAPHWIQTIKVADLISNTSSIVERDPEFAVLYLEEKRELLKVLTLADPRLTAIAWKQV